MTNSINSQTNSIWNSQINLNDLDNQNTITENNQWESIISKINDTQREEDFEVDLRHINTVTKWNKQLWMSKNAKLMILFIFIIIITWLIWFVFFKYDKYIVDYSNWIEDSSDNIVNIYEKTKQQIYDLIGKEYEKKDDSIILDGDTWKANLANLIQSNKWYIYKKETIKNSLKNLFSSIDNNTKQLDDAKKQLSTNWFFSSKLWSIITEEESITSIQDSLNAIEAIKFTSAISVFSQLDTFIESLSNEVGSTKEDTIDNIKMVTKRWEKDINIYIKNCRLNSFEIDYNCNSVWDFDKYYQLTNDIDFNTSFFKKLIQFVNDKLEQTEVPSLTIAFKSFNKKNDELTFDIEINTFKEDEEELAKKWILSSHSFILSNLINNLKLSRAIISEGIEVKAIPVNQRSIKIWETEFIVNTSRKTFSVPIKSENQIEIDDFIYN